MVMLVDWNLLIFYYTKSNEVWCLTLGTMGFRRLFGGRYDIILWFSRVIQANALNLLIRQSTEE